MMKIYDLKLGKESLSDGMNFYKFCLKPNNKEYIKVYIYEDAETFIQKFDNDYYEPKKEQELYELMFNEEFIKAVLNADINAFKFNEEENKKVFEEFRKEIKILKGAE